MDAHFVNYPSPRPSPLQGEGASLAVQQFLELIRGDLPVQPPANRFRVAWLVMNEVYCLSCYGVRHHDVAMDAGRQVVWQHCRCCGKESGYG